GLLRSCLLARQRAAFPEASPPAAPASSQSHARFLPAPLLSLFPARAIPAQWPTPGKHVRLCRRPRSAVSRDAPAPQASLACCEILRSEEHTSELQSPDHLVCRLLLEKKNIIHS